VDAEEAADSEHRDEAKEQRGGRNAADVEADVQRAQQAAEHVVDDQREQEETAAKQEAGAEDEVGRAQFRSTDADLRTGAALSQAG